VAAKKSRRCPESPIKLMKNEVYELVKDTPTEHVYEN